MKILVKATSVWDDNANDILNKYPELKNYNSEVERLKLFIHIDNLGTLFSLAQVVMQDIIINIETVDIPTIEIYDDWRE